MTRIFLLAFCIALASQVPALAQAPDSQSQVKSTFDDGLLDGWEQIIDFSGKTYVDLSLGNPLPALRHTNTIDSWFGMGIENRRAEWLQALRQGRPIRISLDVNALEVSSVPNRTPLARELVVEFRDYDNPPAGWPYVSVWTRIGVLDSTTPGWHRLSARIDDPTSTMLPYGWFGYGAEDRKIRPILPKGRTFADVLAGADSVVFSTYQPGRAYTHHYWDVMFDKITIRTLQR